MRVERRRENNKTTNWWRRFVIVHVEVICQRGERQQDRSSYCKPIRANTSQKSSFVVVSGLHKSFIMMHLRSAFLKKKKRKEIKDEGDKKEEDKKKKNLTHSTNTQSLHMIHTSSSPGRLNGNRKVPVKRFKFAFCIIINSY